MSVCDCAMNCLHRPLLPFRLCSSRVYAYSEDVITDASDVFCLPTLLSHLMRMFFNSFRPSCRRWHLRGGPRQTAQPFWCSFDDVPNCHPLSTSTQPSAGLICYVMRGWKPNEMLNLDWGIPVSASCPRTIPLLNVRFEFFTTGSV